jgi:hypothetical protein
MTVSQEIARGQVDTIDVHQVRITAIVLLNELHERPMKVVLVDAPDQRHQGHRIRVVESRPPKWYLEISKGWGYSKRGQGLFHRNRFVPALERILDGKHRHTAYEKAAMTVIEHAIENPEEVFQP